MSLKRMFDHRLRPATRGGARDTGPYSLFPSLKFQRSASSDKSVHTHEAEPFGASLTPEKRPTTSGGAARAADAAVFYNIRSPVDHAKHQRRIALQILSVVGPAESQGRIDLQAMESLERYCLLSCQSQSVAVMNKVERAEATERDVLQFSERSAWRRILSLLQDDGGQVGLNTAMVGEDSSNLTTTLSTAVLSPPPSRRRRRTLATSVMTVSDEQKRFLVLMDQLETQQASLRAQITEFEDASRYMLSKHFFFDGFYEHRLNRFNNVPRVSADERLRRDRCMLQLEEYRERRECVEARLEEFDTMCFVLSPFLPRTTVWMQWKSLAQRFFTKHFDFLDGDWKREELYERTMLEESFQQDMIRLVQRVLAFIILEEPNRRRQISQEARYHRAVVTQAHHPSLIAMRCRFDRWRQRRSFRKLVGLRSYRDATAAQLRAVRALEARCVYDLRNRFMLQWRRWRLRRLQNRAVAVSASASWTLLGSRYLRMWAGYGAHRRRLLNTCAKLRKRTASSVLDRFVELFRRWHSFALSQRAAQLARTNEQRLLQRAATRWYWGCWLMRRRKLHRIKFFKLEKLAELWRMQRTFSDWGPEGFLTVQRAKHERHAELIELCRQVEVHLIRTRWARWRLVVLRRKQTQRANNLLLLQTKAHTVSRLHTWLRLLSTRSSVRHTNHLLAKFTPHWIAPWFHRWNMVRYRKKESIAISMEQRTICRMVAAVMWKWQRFAHRHRYHRLLRNEGQVTLMEGRNRMRYAIRRLRDWVGLHLLRKRHGAVLALEDLNRSRQLRSSLMKWRLFARRAPKITACVGIRAIAVRRLLSRYFGMLQRWVARKHLFVDKEMVSRSLHRKNRAIFARSVLRRWNARSGRGLATLSRSLSQSRERLVVVYYAKWKRFLDHVKDTRVSENLEAVNVHRWQRLQFRTWLLSARWRRQRRALRALSERSDAHCRETLCRPVLQWLSRRVLARRQITVMAVTSSRRLLGRYWQSLCDFRVRQRVADAEMLKMKNLNVLMRFYWRSWRAACIATKLRRIQRLLYVEPVSAPRRAAMCSLLRPVVDPCAGAARRYFGRWARWLGRRVNQRVAFEALCMLRNFWQRKSVWSLWETRSRGRVSQTREPPNPTSTLNRRQFLRAVAAADHQLASGLRVVATTGT